MADALRAPAIEPAALVWQHGVPESLRFGDVYFSRDNGLEETRHVFLGHNDLPARFAGLGEGGCFVVAENGFGTGLNFLATWQAWRTHRKARNATLHFVSVERFPLTRPDLERALALWPELASLSRALLDNYPPLVRGTHRLVLDGGQVRLTLFFGDIRDAWQSLEFQADAWFLDGFAPARNPDMWLEQTIGQVCAHSKPGTTLATFTSVGRIRRELADAGFRMQKVPGYGRKREMLKGVMPPSGPASGVADQTVAVIGAGIAGSALARNLAERGLGVTLIDQHGPGAGASGNAQGALYVKLGVEFNDQTELALTALTFSQRFYGRFAGNGWHPTGLLQLAHSDQEADRQHRFLARNDYPGDVLYPVSPAQAESLCGVTTGRGGLWFPGSGWLEPARLCRTLADHPRISGIWQTMAGQPVRAGNRLQIGCGNGSTVEADSLVICAGHLSDHLMPGPGPVKLKSIRGQVSDLPANAIQTPRAVICGNRYLNPALGSTALTGATFDLHDDTPEITAASHRENIEALHEMLPGIFPKGVAAALAASPPEGRVGFRCTTHDYQPVAGPACASTNPDLDNLYLFTGLGSKGLTYAPLLAEYLADVLTGQPACLPKRLARRLAVSRIFGTSVSGVAVSATAPTVS